MSGLGRVDNLVHQLNASGSFNSTFIEESYALNDAIQPVGDLLGEVVEGSGTQCDLTIVPDLAEQLRHMPDRLGLVLNAVTGKRMVSFEC